MRRLLREESASRPIADINMTNLVDVTLTLLVLFILVAPVIDQGITLRLPRAGGAAIETVNSLTISLDGTGRIRVEGKPVDVDALAGRVRGTASVSPDTNVVILADRKLDYGMVVQVMDIVRRCGLSNISLATREDGS